MADLLSEAMLSVEVPTSIELIQDLKKAAWDEFCTAIKLLSNCKYSRFMGSVPFNALPATSATGVQHAVIETDGECQVVKLDASELACRLIKDAQGWGKLWSALKVRGDGEPTPCRHMRIPVHMTDIWTYHQEYYADQVMNMWAKNKVYECNTAYKKLMEFRMPPLRPIYVQPCSLRPPRSPKLKKEVTDDMLNVLCTNAVFMGLMWSSADVIGVIAAAGYMSVTSVNSSLRLSTGPSHKSMFEIPHGSILSVEQALYLIKNKALLCRLLYERFRVRR
ncbi:ORF109 [Ranid herpesvirus 2]|uniref:ORF109 n=1 Tax=Ranid herpesvirus 2 TaxID=389214 RepID=Q14VZ7_9VIRU|nr:ORF109 [Ranid herpesvirus 2]ABG25659.1 ORF109 [Ranid herpesvirus 2]